MTATIDRDELMTEVGSLIDIYTSDEIHVSGWDMLTAVTTVANAKDDRGPARMVMCRAVQVAYVFISSRPMGPITKDEEAFARTIVAKLDELEEVIKGRAA